MQPRTTYPGGRVALGEPFMEWDNGERTNSLCVGVGWLPRELLEVDLVLLGIADDIEERHIRRRLRGNGIERIDGNEDRARGIRERLGRHDADAQAGVASGAAADDDSYQIAGPPTLLLEQGANGGRQVASMAAGGVERPCGPYPRSGRQSNLPATAGSFQDQPALHLVFIHAVIIEGTGGLKTA